MEYRDVVIDSVEMAQLYNKNVFLSNFTENKSVRTKLEHWQ